MYYPSKKEFLKLSKKGNLIPVYREIASDLDTPVSAYFKIVGKAKYSFLLESVEGEEKVARYSFVAANPELVIRGKGKNIEILRRHNGTLKRETSGVKDTPLSAIRDIMSKYNFVAVQGLPPFCGGMVGYLSYDVVRFFEKLPHTTKNDLHIPNIQLILAKNLAIFDHRNRNIKVVSCIEIDPKSSDASKSKAYDAATKAIDKMANSLLKPSPLQKQPRAPRSKPLQAKSNLTETQFRTIVQDAKKKIKAGEIIQTVLSQRFEVPVKTNPFNIYRSLRTLNPSPYMFFLNLDTVQIVGSSPELLVRCQDGIVETRPIAGTRPRGKNEREDQKLAKDLLNDPKEKAEHIMLVDLGRNDLGRVCKKGTVRVSEFMEIEKYSHVMHIVSNVQGELKPTKDIFDVLQAGFPAGTVSGAPKIRAMEIIDELENLDRGPYAGCIGYFSFSGNLDTCITIRTIVVTKNKAYVQAGAGIVADSNPRKEYLETINKAKAQVKAIELGHQQRT